MSLQIATVLEETAKNIIMHETNLSCSVATPRVSLHNESRKLEYGGKTVQVSA